MRHSMLLAAFATSVAFAQAIPGGPDDPAAPGSPVLWTELPPLIDPDLRPEGADALRRSDFFPKPGHAPAYERPAEPAAPAKEGK